MLPRPRGDAGRAKLPTLDEGTLADVLLGSGRITLTIKVDDRPMQSYLRIADSALLVRVEALLEGKIGRPMKEIRAIEVS